MVSYETTEDTKENKNMSLYNQLYGYNPACIFVMPFLGRKQEEYPRFRDCFAIAAPEVREIHIFTRVGSCNQGCGYGEEKLYEDPNYLRFEDDDRDPTYGTYIFKCPKEWEADFDAIVAGKFSELSDAYYEMQRKFWKDGEKMVEKIKQLAAKVDMSKEMDK